MDISVVGAAAVLDYIYRVDRLPVAGQISQIISDSQGPYFGGGAPNIASGLARLGHRVQLFYPVGDDFLGSSCETFWNTLGIDLSMLTVIKGQRSGFAYLFFNGEDNFCFAFPGASARAINPGEVKLAKRVVIGPVLNAYTISFLDAALKEGSELIVSGIASSSIVDYLAYIQVFIVSWEEANALCEQLKLDSLQHLADRMSDAKLYITHGKEGSVLYHNGSRREIPVISANQLVDPTGAGDAYTAGVVTGILRGFDPVISGFIGATVASYAVEKVGAQNNLPDWPLVIDRLKAQAPDVSAGLEA